MALEDAITDALKRQRAVTEALQAPEPEQPEMAQESTNGEDTERESNT